MKAIVLHQPGSVDQLHYTDIAKPEPGDREVLVAVRAIGINPVDVKTRLGKGIYGRLKEVSTLIIGWDIAGIVVSAGKEVTGFKAGDEVFGMVNFPGHGQGYAEYVVAPAAHLALKSSNISFEQAAASTLAALTAWQILAKEYRIQPGQQVLVHAAAGGVGHFAVQIARHLGAHVTGTSSGLHKDFVHALGADAHIDYRNYDWQQHGRTFDFVLDAIGGDNVDHSIAVTRPGGTVVSIPTGLNEQVVAHAKAQGVHGASFMVSSDGEDMKQLAQLLGEGILRPYISGIYSFNRMAEAHQQQESGRTRGKIVVRL